MGLFDGLLDAFSSDDENRYLQSGNRRARRDDRRAINTYEDYGGDQRDTLREGLDDSIGALHGGTDQAAGYLQAGITPFQDLFDQGMWGIGQHRAYLEDPDKIFQSELYKQREQAGIDQINRMANARGGLASGNNTQDQLDYMRRGGLEYWTAMMNQFDPYFDIAQGGASGIQQGNTNLANLYGQQGVNEANLIRGYSGDIGNSYQHEGDMIGGTQSHMGDRQFTLGQDQASASAATGANWANLLNAVVGGGARAWSGNQGA